MKKLQRLEFFLENYQFHFILMNIVNSLILTHICCNIMHFYNINTSHFYNHSVHTKTYSNTTLLAKLCKRKIADCN